MDEQKNASEPNAILTENSKMVDVLQALKVSIEEGNIAVMIEKDLADWIDSQVKTQKYRNRSHVVQVALLKMKNENRLP